MARTTVAEDMALEGELAEIVIGCLEYDEVQSEAYCRSPAPSDPTVMRASELLRELTNSSSAYTIPEVIEIISNEGDEVLMALKRAEEVSGEFDKKSYLVRSFRKSSIPREYKRFCPLLMDPSIYNLWGQSDDPLPARDWAAEFGTMRVSERPKLPIPRHSEPEYLPVLWLEARVLANFPPEAERAFDRLHEQWIGALLVFDLAKVETAHPILLQALAPWPGETGFCDEKPFPPLRTKHRALSVAHCDPADLDDFERHRIAEHDRLAGRSKKFPTLFGAESEDTIRIRTSLANFARASLEAEPGEAFLRLAMCLEGLLVSVSKDDNTARVSEAAAHYLGGPRARREEMRSLVVELYTARSQYVHAGRLEGPSSKKRSHARLLEESFSLVREILRREIRDLPDPPRVKAEGDDTGSEHPPD